MTKLKEVHDVYHTRCGSMTVEDLADQVARLLTDVEASLNPVAQKSRAICSKTHRGYGSVPSAAGVAILWAEDDVIPLLGRFE